MKFITEAPSDQWVVDEMVKHIGHNVKIVTYGDNQPSTVLECLDCNEVVLYFEGEYK